MRSCCTVTLSLTARITRGSRITEHIVSVLLQNSPGGLRWLTQMGTPFARLFPGVEGPDWEAMCCHCKDLHEAVKCKESDEKQEG